MNFCFHANIQNYICFLGLRLRVAGDALSVCVWCMCVWGGGGGGVIKLP